MVIKYNKADLIGLFFGEKMKNILLVLTILISTSNVFGKALDKMVAVIDDEIITQSMVQRIKANLKIRKNIAPFIYTHKSPTTKQITSIRINSKIIRDKIAEFGYAINDQQVESNINQRIKSLGFTKNSLIQFLKQNNMNFSEYFELTREAIEFSVFSDKVIKPMINITEQQVKNKYFQQNVKSKTIAFTYDLVDFYLPKKKVNNAMRKKFTKVLETFQSTGNLPKRFANVETNNLGQVEEDGLTPELKELLKRTDEGSFSKPVLLGDNYHVFFIRKKDLKKADNYLRAKEKIKFDLIQEATQKMITDWLERQQNKHYIKYFI